jgi:hypothetical protein
MLECADIETKLEAMSTMAKILLDIYNLNKDRGQDIEKQY